MNNRTLSATELCNRYGIDRSAFWAAMQAAGLITPDRQLTSSGAAAGIEVAQSKTGHPYLRYPPSVLDAVPTAELPRSPSQSGAPLSIAEFCSATGTDPGSLREALIKSGVLKSEGGKVSPGPGFSAAKAETRRVTDTATGKQKYLMLFPLGVLFKAAQLKERDRQEDQEPQGSHRKPDTRPRTSGVSLKKVVEFHSEALSCLGRAVNKDNLEELLYQRGVLVGDGEPGPNAELAGARRIRIEKPGERPFRYTGFDIEKLGGYLLSISKEPHFALPPVRPRLQKIRTDSFRALSSVTDSSRILVFDTETTGIDARRNDLLQITVAIGTLEELAADPESCVAISTYVRPEIRDSWDEAGEVNGIRPGDVSSAPTLEQVSRMVAPLFGSADYVVGQNVAFDVGFVTQKLGIPINPRTVIDTIEIAKGVLPGLPSYRLGALVEEATPGFVEKYRAGAHDARTDTVCTAAVFASLRETAVHRDFANEPEAEP